NVGDVQKDVDDFTDVDYEPYGDSSSDDGLSEGDLGTDDEEYLSARRDKHRNGQDDSLADIAEIINSHQSGDYSDDSDSSICSHEESVDGSDDSDNVCKPKKKCVVYDPECDKKTIQFVLGMRFVSVAQCKDAIQSHAVYNGLNIQFMRSSEKQVEARCTDGCPWKLYASLVRAEGMVAIKTLVSEHKCHRDMNTRQASSSWVAKEFLEKFGKKTRMKVGDLEEQILDKYAVQPSRWKLYRGKYKALELLRGTETEHYACLRSYIAELQRVDRSGRFELLLDVGSVFKAFFVVFSSLRQGFLEGCRPVIGFDGCFLKTCVGGALLCAIGKDGNNQIFPIAWAVADSENEQNWKWFLEILFNELRIGDGLGWTFISDQQK
ncbi:Unknown protein, partial [Striga hermonthica]